MHRPSSAIQFTDKNDFRTNKTLTSIALTKGVALRNHFLSDLNHELPNTIMTTGYTAVLYATKNIKNIAYHAFFYEFFDQLVNKIPRHSVSLPTDLFNLPSLIQDDFGKKLALIASCHESKFLIVGPHNHDRSPLYESLRHWLSPNVKFIYSSSDIDGLNALIEWASKN